MTPLAWTSGAMLLAAAASALAAPVDSGDADRAPTQLGQAFVLQPGQSVAAGSAASGVLVGFDRVLTDSRCPKGAQCIWAGDATVLVWLARPNGPRITGELHTTPGRANVLTAAGHSLALIRLEPAPISGRTNLQTNYRATLVLQVTSATSDSLAQ